MKITASQTARLEFLARVTDKECQHLLDTDGRLFGKRFTIEEAQNEDLAVLASALRSGHAFVPALVTAARRCVAEAGRLLTANAATPSSKA